MVTTTTHVSSTVHDCNRDGLSARMQQEHVSLNMDHHVDLLREDLAKLKQVGMAIRDESSLQQQMLDNLVRHT